MVKFCGDTFRNRFGSWTRAVTLAGLRPGHSAAVGADAILRDIAEVARELKCTKLDIRQYKKRGRYSWRMVYPAVWHVAGGDGGGGDRAGEIYSAEQTGAAGKFAGYLVDGGASAEDGGSGVAAVTVQYRAVPDAFWIF